MPHPTQFRWYWRWSWQPNNSTDTDKTKEQANTQKQNITNTTSYPKSVLRGTPANNKKYVLQRRTGEIMPDIRSILIDLHLMALLAQNKHQIPCLQKVFCSETIERYEKLRVRNNHYNKYLFNLQSMYWKCFDTKISLKKSSQPIFG